MYNNSCDPTKRLRHLRGTGVLETCTIKETQTLQIERGEPFYCETSEIPSEGTEDSFFYGIGVQKDSNILRRNTVNSVYY